MRNKYYCEHVLPEGYASEPHVPLAPDPILPDVGGALRLGGGTSIRDCAFISNLASSGGLAVAAVGSVEINDSSFRGNVFICGEGTYLRTEKVCKRPAPVSLSIQVVSNANTQPYANHIG